MRYEYEDEKNENPCRFKDSSFLVDVDYDITEEHDVIIHSFKLITVYGEDCLPVVFTVVQREKLEHWLICKLVGSERLNNYILDRTVRR